MQKKVCRKNKQIMNIIKNIISIIQNIQKHLFYEFIAINHKNNRAYLICNVNKTNDVI